MQANPASPDDRFNDLVHRQARYAFTVAYAVLRNASDAEDVVQEMFFKLYRTGAWESIDSERAFLSRATWRLAVDKRSAKPSETLDVEPPTSDASPEDRAISGDWTRAVHRLVDALPEPLRQPLALSSVDGMNSREIARTLGIPEGTVRTRLMRARQLLKERLSHLESRRCDK